MSIRSLSYSEITTALKCFASWDFAYGDVLAGASLKKRETAAVLSDGRAWGQAVASWHATGDRYAAYRAISSSLSEDYQAMRERGYSPDLAEYVEQTQLLGAIFEHYIEDSVRMESFGQAEREIEVPVPARTGTGRASSRYRYQCFLDGHHTYHGHPAIAEFKLRASLTDVAVIQRQPQYRWYAWAYAQEIGWDGPVTVTVDERLKEAPKPARLIKAAAKDITCPVCGAPPGMPCNAGQEGRARKGYHAERKEQKMASHAVDQITTPELYQQACFDTKAFVDNETLRALQSRVWQRRTPLTFTPAEIEEAGKELATSGLLISQLDNGTLYPIRNGSPQNCRGCRYKDICGEPRNSFAVGALFELRPAKRDRAKEPV